MNVNELLISVFWYLHLWHCCHIILFIDDCFDTILKNILYTIYNMSLFNSIFNNLFLSFFQCLFYESYYSTLGILNHEYTFC